MPKPKLNEKQRQRLKSIKMADKNGMTAAAEKFGISRVMLHRWRNRYLTEGVDGLCDRSHRPMSNPTQTPPDVIKQVLDTALANPALGCRKIVGLLKQDGIIISEPTVQKFLVSQKLGRVKERVGYVEQAILAGEIKPSIHLIAECEKSDPVFRERDRTGKRPGSLLYTDIIHGGIVEGGKRLYIAVVIDMSSLYTWAYCYLRDDKLPHLEILYQMVLPDLESRKIDARTIITPDMWPWTGDSFQARSFNQRVCDIWGMKHQIEQLHILNGYAEWFQREFKSWFRRECLNGASLEKVGNELAEWLEVRNQNIITSFPNFGKSPLEAVKSICR